jgi:serine/threonine-protein kinase
VAAQARALLERYQLYGEIASGGMATVHLGRLRGPAGFSRIVAIKKLHPQLAKEPEFIAMFLDEARLAARIHHPNVVQTLDVIAAEGEVLLVMEYVHGEALSRLLRASAEAGERAPAPVAVAVLIGVLEGLHAAHEATSSDGKPLGLVHRDVSPHNVLVGPDGIARLLDFGVAKAAGRLQTTRDGRVKGKFAYMAPEQINAEPLDRRADLFACGVVLWEMLVGSRLFQREDPGSVVHAVLTEPVTAPRTLVPELPAALDEAVMCALRRRREERFASARAMAEALERAVAPATARAVGAWVERMAPEALARSARALASLEGGAREGEPPTEPDTGSAPTAARAWDATGPDGATATHSQVSGISIPSTRVRRWSTAVWLSVGALGLALGLGTVVMLRDPAPFRASSRALDPTGADQAASSVTPYAPAASTEPGPRVSTPTSPQAIAEASAARPVAAGRPSALVSSPPPPFATASTVALPRTPGGGGHEAASTGKAAAASSGAPGGGGPAAASTGKAATPSCANKFIIDAQGNKKPRPECFE